MESDQPDGTRHSANTAVSRMTSSTWSGPGSMNKAAVAGRIHVPLEWDDRDLLTFEEFCALIHIPSRTVRDWRRRHVGPRWHKLPGTGRLYITVGETRRFLTFSSRGGA